MKEVFDVGETCSDQSMIITCFTYSVPNPYIGLLFIRLQMNFVYILYQPHQNVTNVHCGK
ncbi:MAG: hypothetical protein ACPGO5_00695 [Patescibacteria group bacterium]